MCGTAGKMEKKEGGKKKMPMCGRCEADDVSGWTAKIQLAARRAG